MLSQPEPEVSPSLGVSREIERILKRQSRRTAANDRREVENRKRYHPRSIRGVQKRPRDVQDLGRSLLQLLSLLLSDVHDGAHPRVDAALILLVAGFIS